MEDSIKSNKSLLNGFPLINYGTKLARKIVNDVEVPLQIKHGSHDARLLVEIALLSGFSAFDGGGISHNIPFSKSISLKDSLENWKYVDRLVGIYEENGIKINREIFSPLTATLVPPAISNSIQILETLLAVEQGVKNISIGVAQYGNITQDIASLLALKEHIQFYLLDTFSFKDINISTVFNQWIGGFPEEELKAYSLISYSTTIALFSKTNRIFVKNIDEYAKNSLGNTMINSLLLTKTILDIGNLPFCPLIEEFHNKKIKERAEKENREINFQMTIDDIFAMSQGKLTNKKSRE